MIKQSRNAVTMLLSCFKGIYQSAYVKGIASAVVLTAGLAAGAANAANIDGAQDTTDSSVWLISGSASIDEDTVTTNIPATVTTIKVTGAVGVVTVSPSSEAYDVDRDYDLVVENGGQYTVSGANSQPATDNWNNISVTGGTVTIGGAGDQASTLGTTAEGNIILNSATTTTAKVVLNAGGANATFGTANKSAITLDGNAQIEITGSESGSVVGASFTMEDTLTTKVSATPSVSVADNAVGDITVKNFTMEGGYIKNLGTLSIGDTGSTITITGGTIENGTAASDVITFKSDVTLGKGVTVLNNNSGKIAFEEDAIVDASLFKLNSPFLIHIP